MLDRVVLGGMWTAGEKVRVVGGFVKDRIAGAGAGEREGGG